jgi:phenylacetate-CoA ligase
MKSLYKTCCEDLLLPLGDVISRQQVMQAYRFYSESQWWDRERLVAYQNDLLKETIRTAYLEVPFYKRLYDEKGVNIEDIASAEQLPLLPPVNKPMLRAAYDDCIRDTGYTRHEYFTSGSSGQPFAVVADSLSMSQARALMLLRASFSGWEIGEPCLQTGMTLQRGLVKGLKDLLLRTHYVSAFDLSDETLDVYLDTIEKKKLKYVMGYAGSMYLLAVRAAETGFDRKLEGVVSWGDNLYSHYRSMIETQFGCRVTDTYGCGEGIQIAAQCGMNDGAYHVFMPHVIVEIVDENDQPVPRGEVGNILLTRLDAGAMPLVRYRVGDLGRAHLSDSCPCGRGLTMLAKIEGRDSDVIRTPNGNKLIVHFFTGIFEYYKSIRDFCVVQHEDGSVTVKIVPGPDFQMSDWEKISREILEKGDKALKLRPEIVSEISDRSSNKRRFVISERARQ